MDLMTAIAGIPGVGPFLPYIAAFVAVCAALAMALPPPSGNGAYATFYRLVNLVALNMGHAKNANAPDSGRAVIPPAGAALLLLCAAQLTLSACTNAQVADFCAKDAALQPKAVALASDAAMLAPLAGAQGAAAGGVLAAGVAVDTAAVHPLVQGECPPASGTALNGVKATP